MANDALIQRVTVVQLVAAFGEAEASVRAAFASIVATEERVNRAFGMGADHRTICVYASPTGHREDFKNIDRTVGEMRRRAWQSIAARLELRRMLSVTRFEAMEKYLDETPMLPEITEPNVNAFVGQFVAGFQTMIEEAIVEVFDWLRPAGKRGAGRYVTNQRIEVGARVILTRMVKRSCGSWQILWDEDAHLTALENVLSMLGGKGMTNKAPYSMIHNAVAAAGFDGLAQTDLFEIRCCQNGNLHLAFRDLKLLEKFNAAAGGKRFHPGPGT